MPGIDYTKPEDITPIDAAAYLCWGQARGDLYDAIHAMKKENERLRKALWNVVHGWDVPQDENWQPVFKKVWDEARAALKESE